MKTIYTLLLLAFSFTAFAQLDPGFGTNGHRTLGTIDKDDYPSFITPTLDNAFLVGDYDPNSIPARAMLIKIKADGSTDVTFANNGVFEYNFLPGTIGGFYDVIQQADSSYLVFGNYGIPGISTTNLIIRIDQNGVLDNTYNIDGKITLNLTPLIGAARTAMVDNNGSILVAGAYTTGFALDECYVCRFDANGFLDSSFATQGILTWNLFDSSACFPVKIFQPDNLHYLLAVRIYNNGNRTLLIRLHNNGSIDSTFGNNGIVTMPWINQTNLIGVKLHNNYCYYYGSFRNLNATKSKTYLYRTDFSGQLDLSFGTGGIDTSVVDTLYEYAASGLEIDANGNFLFSGTVLKDTAAFYMIKKTPNLVFDNTFGNNGLLTTKTDSSQNDFGNMSCLLYDGNWIVGGHYYTLYLNQGSSYDIDMTFCKVKLQAPAVINHIDDAMDGSVYPNPCHDQFMLTFPVRWGNIGSAEVWSLTGQRIVSISTAAIDSNRVLLNASSWSNGLYIVRCQNEQGRVFQKLVFKQ